MKTKIIDFIKKYLIWFIAGVVFLLFFFGALDKCSIKKTGQVITTTETADLRHFLTDSLKTVRANEKIAAIEAGKQIEAKNTLKYKANAVYFAKVALNQKHISDSLQNLIPKEDTTCLKTLESKQIEIDNLTDENKNLDSEAESYSKQLYLCESQNVIKDTIIQGKNNYIDQTLQTNIQLKKQLKNTPSIWHKAGDLIFKGVIIAETTYIILKGL